MSQVLAISNYITTYNKVLSLDNRDIHVVGGGTDIFKFLSAEDINAYHVYLGMPMFASLGS